MREISWPAVALVGALVLGAVGVDGSAGATTPSDTHGSSEGVARRGPAGWARMAGRVESGGDGLSRAAVTMYATTDRGRRSVLGHARTDRDGNFELRYHPPRDPDAVLYVMTRGGRTETVRWLPGSYRLVSVFAPGHVPDHVVVNELTTVGSAFGMAQFVGRHTIAGPAPGLPRAAAMIGHLADVRTGELGFSVQAYATPEETSPRTLRSLANMLASCTVDRWSCRQLIDLARADGQRRPTDTFEALALIADNPTNNVPELYELSTGDPAPYQPALVSSPTAWTVAVRLMGPIVEVGGDVISSEFDGPGLVAFDADGDAWISNNYEWGMDPAKAVCAGKAVFHLDPTVTGPAVLTDSLTRHETDQLWGAGFGIAIDPHERVWVGNFGFQGGDFGPGPACTEDVYKESVSLFAPDGAPISWSTAENPPSGGYTAGDISGPQGMLSDDDGNLWIANCGNRSVTLYPHGDPAQAVNIAPEGMQQPFGLWLDDHGNAWVASNQSGQVFAFDSDGNQLEGSPFGDPTPTRSGDALLRSMGITVDSHGNKWVANSFWVNAPCDDWAADAFEGLVPGGSITLLNTDGPTATLQQYTSDSLANPWGIAVDGDDHVFVANFGNQRLAEFCGVQVDTCPRGMSTGQPIGDDGYPYDGLDRNTSVSIDPSGHVWLANNWLDVPIQANPGGHAVVVYFGLAEPIQTPVHGPPVRVFSSRRGP